MKRQKSEMREPLKKHPLMQPWKKFILGMPLALSVSWMVYLRLQAARYSGELLSPLPTRPLMIALLIFSLGYVLFLVLLFSDDLRSMFASSHKAR
ncbi:hypothetical protein HYU14_01630 [Candidatus Woesearchaeota archaeon]|nr:hypothetical protein [Candidatus Woesearchaeota archaeon]